MKQISLLQIGDIHFDSINKSKLISGIDHKDQHFNGNLIKKINCNTICTTILKKILREMQDSANKIIIFTGDLSNRGDQKTYETCVNFLQDRIPGSFFNPSSDSHIFIVPGNHDVDRNKVQLIDDYIPKFERINVILKELKFPEIPLDGIKFYNYQFNKCSIRFFSINSCIGCGEIRFFEKEITDQLKKSKLNKKNYDILDTPLIQSADIEQVKEEIEKDPNTLPVILAHHNLLPQKKPRIALYAELLNGGYVRDELLKLNRPILFIHGHIHDDPIEVIESPVYKNAKVVCISAPLLFPLLNDDQTNFGFNKIKLIFTDTGVPLGCEIEKIRSMNTRENDYPIRIPFVKPFESHAYLSTIDKIVLEQLRNMNSTFYFFELLDICKKNKKSIKSNTELNDCLIRLNWFGLINYSDDQQCVNSPVDNRIIKKVIP